VRLWAKAKVRRQNAEVKALREKVHLTAKEALLPAPHRRDAFCILPSYFCLAEVLALPGASAKQNVC
jgi:hypothetical protein